MTKGHALSLFHALTELAKHARSPKLAYALAKNRRLLEDEAAAIEAGRIALVETHAEHGADGKPKTAPMTNPDGSEGFRYIVADPPAFEAALKVYLAEEATAVVLHKVPLALIEADASWAPGAPLGELLAPLVGTIIEE